MKNFVEELRWRGMIQDIMPGTEEKLMEGSTAAYVGIDPTADSLHIGHMVSIMILKHFQNCGHKPIALAGTSGDKDSDHETPCQKSAGIRGNRGIYERTDRRKYPKGKYQGRMIVPFLMELYFFLNWFLILSFYTDT